jgi:hypothetical protein
MARIITASIVLAGLLVILSCAAVLLLVLI